MYRCSILQIWEADGTILEAVIPTFIGDAAVEEFEATTLSAFLNEFTKWSKDEGGLRCKPFGNDIINAFMCDLVSRQLTNRHLAKTNYFKKKWEEIKQQGTTTHDDLLTLFKNHQELEQSACGDYGVVL